MCPCWWKIGNKDSVFECKPKKNTAPCGNRTRVISLEGCYANHYTMDHILSHTKQAVVVHMPDYFFNPKNACFLCVFCVFTCLSVTQMILLWQKINLFCLLTIFGNLKKTVKFFKNRIIRGGNEISGPFYWSCDELGK